ARAVAAASAGAGHRGAAGRRCLQRAGRLRPAYRTHPADDRGGGAGTLQSSRQQWRAFAGAGPDRDRAGRPAGGAGRRLLAVLRRRGLSDPVPAVARARLARIPARAVGRATADDGGLAAADLVVLRTGLAGGCVVEPDRGAAGQLRDRALCVVRHAAAGVVSTAGHAGAVAGCAHRACAVVAARAHGELARCALVSADGATAGTPAGGAWRHLDVPAARRAAALAWGVAVPAAVAATAQRAGR